MPNKKIAHVKLDAAIKDLLLQAKPVVSTDWASIESLLPKKSAASRKVSLKNFTFSLNSFAGLFSFVSFSNFDQVAIFIKKWSTALYVVTGSLLVGAGGFWLYNNSADTNAPATTVEQAVTNEVKTDSPILTIPTNTEASAAAPTTLQNEMTETDAQKNIVEENVAEPLPSARTPETDNLTPNIVPPVVEKQTSKNMDPVELKAEETKKEDTFNLKNEETTKDELDKKKILYYKESLSIDKQIQPTAKDSVE